MKSHLKLIAFFVIQAQLCVCISAEINFMKLDEGQENCNYIQNSGNSDGFIPYSKIFVRNGQFFSITIPASKVIYSSNFTGLAKVPVKSGTIYTLKVTAMGVEQLNMTISGQFFRGNEYMESLCILRNLYF